VDPVCGFGKGFAPCATPDIGCTYDNLCIAQCVYSIKQGLSGACKDPRSKRVGEASSAGSSAQQQQKAGSKDESGCDCAFTKDPVCATHPACTLPGGHDGESSGGGGAGSTVPRCVHAQIHEPPAERLPMTHANAAPACCCYPTCTHAGGCTYANACFAKCYGAKVQRKGSCRA
jgi:hypothetical protein